MHITSLHRKVVRDMELMSDAVNSVLPVKMPLRYEHRRMYLGSFVKRLNTATEQFNVVNEVSLDKTIPKGSMAVSGVWYPEDLLPENGCNADIRIIWHPHPRSYALKMSPRIWARRRYYFWERVAHELVHRYQDLDRPPDTGSRTFKVRTVDDERAMEQKQYFSDYDELEAYAHDAALELLTWWPGLSLPHAIGKTNELKDNAYVWATYRNYLDTFEPGHPARPRFRRKVRQWYHAMQQTPEFYTKLALPSLI